MHKTNIVLYILSRNKNNLRYYLVSTEESKIICPKNEIAANVSLQHNCYLLYQKYIDIKKDILDFKILDIDISDEINIICFTLIPFGLKLTNSYLLPIESDDIPNKYLQKIINFV